MDSDWVEDEVDAAIEKEGKFKTTILFPVRLDNSVMDTEKSWVAKIRRSRHIGNFSNWEKEDAYKKALGTLLNDLIKVS